MKTRHNYRDSLFVDLFGKCKDAKENFLSLYNAIHDTNLKIDEVTIEPVTLKNIVYTGINNDVSMRINDKVIVLAEQQSTINNNMPLRCLEYVTAMYSKMYKKEQKYAKKLIELPAPEFYVFYNGQISYPKESVMKLSDSFKKESNNPCLELTVRVFNINFKESLPILSKSTALFAYSKFTLYVIIARKKGLEDTVGYALDRCISENLLADYFEKLKREDRGMIFGEYSREDDIRVQRQEAYEDGILQGAQAKAVENAVNFLRENFPAEIIARCCSLPLEKVLELKNNLETVKI